MPIRVKVKGATVKDKQPPKTASEETSAPEHIEALFNTNVRPTHRRSMQLSVPDPTMAVMIGLQNKVIGVSFSEATREIWNPYLDVLRDILKERNYLNEFDNIAVPLPELNDAIKKNRLDFLRDYIMRCKKRGLNTSWINTSEL